MAIDEIPGRLEGGGFDIQYVTSGGLVLLWSLDWLRDTWRISIRHCRVPYFIMHKDDYSLPHILTCSRFPWQKSCQYQIRFAKY